MANNVGYIKQLLDLQANIHSRIRNEIEDALVGRTDASNYDKIAESIKYRIKEKGDNIKNCLELEEKS